VEHVLLFFLTLRLCNQTPRNQEIKGSGDQGINRSGYQGIKTSRGSRISRGQGIKGSTDQDIKGSRDQGIKESVIKRSEIKSRDQNKEWMASRFETPRTPDTVETCPEQGLRFVGVDGEAEEEEGKVFVCGSYELEPETRRRFGWIGLFFVPLLDPSSPRSLSPIQSLSEVSGTLDSRW